MKTSVSPKKAEAKQSTARPSKSDRFLEAPFTSRYDHIMHLQRTRGNQATGRLLRSGLLQAKLRIGRPNDRYEQEADRVADQIINMPSPVARQQVDSEDEEQAQAKTTAEQSSPRELQRMPIEYEEDEVRMKPAIQKQPKEYEDEEESILTKGMDEARETITDGTEEQINLLRGNGRPIPKTEQTFFESRFGEDFQKVRLHTGNHASDTARSLNARAFTLGHNIVFGEGQYQPQTTAGKRLIAHELTHVIQQNPGASRTRSIGRRGPDVQSTGKRGYIQRGHISRYRPTYSPSHWDYTFRSNGHIIATAKRGANLGGLSRYWSWRAANYTAITHANGSRVTNPNLIQIGSQFDVFPIMPAFYRTIVGTTGTGNCGNAIFAYLGMCTGPGNNTRAQDYALYRQLSAGATSYAGNVVVFSTTGSAPRSASELKHWAIYLANGYVFTKNGMGSGQYQVMTLSGVVAIYGSAAGRWHK